MYDALTYTHANTHTTTLAHRAEEAKAALEEEKSKAQNLESQNNAQAGGAQKKFTPWGIPVR